MASEFSQRTQAQGRIVFWLGRIKKLTGVMHSDCHRAGDTPNHVDLNVGVLFEALSRAQIRESDIELVSANAKAVDPGKFKDERKWPESEKLFMNYLSVIPGVNGIPRLYLVRESETPELEEVYASFNKHMIYCAPFEGQCYLADSRRVHPSLYGFLQRENTESWIRGSAKYQDGRRDMIALRRHYAGEVLPFNKFLDTSQRMFSIFEEENKPSTESAKVDKFLLTKVQNSGLATAVTQAQTPDYQLLRRTSTSSSGCGYEGRGKNLKTTYYPKEEWEKLSYKERGRIRKERDRKGEQGGTKRSIAEMSSHIITNNHTHQLLEGCSDRGGQIRQ